MHRDRRDAVIGGEWCKTFDSWWAKQTVDFAVDGDGESEASGSKSKRGDGPTEGYAAMQT